MKKFKIEYDETTPRVALGIPISFKVRDEKSEHKPGFLEEKKPKIPTTKERGRVELPPYDPEKVPRTSLAERLRKRIAQMEVEK